MGIYLFKYIADIKNIKLTFQNRYLDVSVIEAMKSIILFIHSNPNENQDRYKRVIQTPPLSIEDIFPDQFAQYQRQQRLKQQAMNKNVVINNSKVPAKQQVIVGQSPDDAPMQLTNNYRAQPAKLFTSNWTNYRSFSCQCSNIQTTQTRSDCN